MKHGSLSVVIVAVLLGAGTMLHNGRMLHIQLAVFSLFEACPPIMTSRSIVLVRLGANQSSGVKSTIAAATVPWARPYLADELRRLSVSYEAVHLAAYNAQGDEIRCATQIPSCSGYYVYVSMHDMPWQWPTEYVGYERVLSIPALRFDTQQPIGSTEAAWEATAGRMTGCRQEQLTADSVVSASCADIAPSHARQTDQEDATWDKIVLQTLSTSPPIFRAQGLFSDEVLDALHKAAMPHFERSTVGDPTRNDASRAFNSPHTTYAGETAHPVSDSSGVSTQYRRVDDRRTSESAWLHGYNDPRQSHAAARAVQRRVAALLGLPATQWLRSIEPLLAVRYRTGAFYEPHDDFFAGGDSSSSSAEPAYAPPHGSNRYATVLIYLSSAESDNDGGHTVFPFASATNRSASLSGITFAGDDASNRCNFPARLQRRGMMVKPRRGDAVIFYNQHVDGRLDSRLKHGSCPVLRGTKEAINVWVWNRDVIYR